MINFIVRLTEMSEKMKYLSRFIIKLMAYQEIMLEIWKEWCDHARLN